MAYQADAGHHFSSPPIKLKREWLIHIDGAGTAAGGIRAEGRKLGRILVSQPAVLGGDGGRRPIYCFGNRPSTGDTLRRVHPGGIARSCERAAISEEQEGILLSEAGCRRRIVRRGRPFKSDVGNSVDSQRRVRTWKDAHRTAYRGSNCRCGFCLCWDPRSGWEPRTMLRKGVDRVIFQIGVNLRISRCATGDTTNELVAYKTEVCGIQYDDVRVRDDHIRTVSARVGSGAPGLD